MPIKTQFNTYVAPVVQRHNETPTDYSGIGNALSALGKIVGRSMDARDSATAEKVMSDYQTKSLIKLKELELSGSKTLESDLSKYQDDLSKELLDGQGELITKTFTENRFRMDNSIKLKAKSAQLNVDAAIQHNDTQEAIANLQMGIRADPSSFGDNLNQALALINSPNTYMTVEQRLKTTRNVIADYTTYKAIGDYESGTSVKDVVDNLSSGKYDTDIFSMSVNGKPYIAILDKAERAVAAKTLITQDFNTRLQQDPESLKKDIDGGNYPWKTKELGELVDPKDKASMLSQLNNALKRQEITLKDRMVMEKNAIFDAAYNGDSVSIERARTIAESPDASKSDKEMWEYIKNKNPVDTTTSEDAYGELSGMLNEMSDIDIGEPATELQASGTTRFVQAQLKAYRYIQDMNQKMKNLSPEDVMRWDALVRQFGNLRLDNKKVFIDAFSVGENVIGAHGKFNMTNTSTTVSKQRKSFADAQTKAYVNKILDICIDSKLNETERSAKINEAKSRYQQTMTFTFFPYLRDNSTGKLIKENSEIMINNVPFIFKGLSEDGISPNILLKR